MAEPAPLWAHFEDPKSQTGALLVGAVKDLVDTVLAKPLGMCDCFYLLNTKKYKNEFYEKERKKTTHTTFHT